jgi:hypothetical protein
MERAVRLLCSSIRKGGECPGHPIVVEMTEGDDECPDDYARNDDEDFSMIAEKRVKNRV